MSLHCPICIMGHIYTVYIYNTHLYISLEEHLVASWCLGEICIPISLHHIDRPTHVSAPSHISCLHLGFRGVWNLAAYPPRISLTGMCIWKKLTFLPLMEVSGCIFQARFSFYIPPGLRSLYSLYFSIQNLRLNSYIFQTAEEATIFVVLFMFQVSLLQQCSSAA